MCGIVAVWNRQGSPIDRHALARAVGSLQHRGPDDEGYVLIDTRTGASRACRGRDTVVEGLPTLEAVAGDFDLALGHRRLAIVDRSSRGHQPMGTPDGRIWVVFNGMIYNWQELRSELDSLGFACRTRSDTEVVLQAYACWGEGCFARFNGMWAVAVWDSRSRQLLASRDRFGVKPLVYRVDVHRVLIASELEAVSSLGGLDDGIEPKALHHYLSLMEVPAPYTIYRHAFKLQPAHTLKTTVSEARDECYWRIPITQSTLSWQENADRLDTLLQDAVRLRLQSDVPVGSYLSGGIDSSLVAALAAHQGTAPLTTFNVSTPSEPQVDEAPWAAQVAALIGSRHVRVDAESGAIDALLGMCAGLREPFAVSSVLGVYLIAKAARAMGTHVLLSGDGADEVFGGYLHRHVDIDRQWDAFERDGNVASDERSRAAGERVRWRALTSDVMQLLRVRGDRMSDAAGREFHAMHRRCMFNDVEKHALYSSSWRASLVEEDTIPWLQSRTLPPTPDRMLRRQLHDIETLLHDEMLAKLDRGTMACGIEGRTPLLDYRIVEMAVSLPLSQRYAEGQGKWLLRQVARRYLPEAVVSRPKRGFTIPLDVWLRHDLRQLLYDTLAPAAVRRVGVFDADVVREVLAWFERDPNYQSAHMVFTMMTLQAWAARYAPGGA